MHFGCSKLGIDWYLLLRFCYHWYYYIFQVPIRTDSCCYPGSTFLYRGS